MAADEELPVSGELQEAMDLCRAEDVPLTAINITKARRAVRLAHLGLKVGDKNDGGQN